MANRVHALLRQAAAQPGKAAIRFEDRAISFGELAALVSQTAGGLRALGIGAGSRVGLFMPSQPDFVVVQQALFLLGAVVSPINAAYRPAEIVHAVNTCELDTIVTTCDLGERMPTGERGQMPGLARVILIDQHEDSAGFRSLPLACTRAQPVTEAAPVADRDVVMLLNTSATTGKSKGVMLTAGNLAANYDRTPGWLGLMPDDVIACALPLYNTFGLNQCINAMTSLGVTLVLIPRFDAAQLIAAIRKHGCTFLPAVPTMLQKLLEELAPGSDDLRSVRLIMTGGAPVPSPLLARLKTVLDPSARVVTGYGLTEGTALVTLTDVELGDDGEIVRGRTIGRVLDGMWMGVLREDGTLAESGEVGEFVLRGPNLMAGYHGAPEDTAAALAGDMLHTGDIGTIDAEGYAYIVDRKKDVIIRGGQNIYPADIEEVLYAVEGVAEVAVVAREDELMGEVPVAWVALSAGCAVEAETLLARCREELAPFKRPAAIHFLPELPKGPTGKILRRALRDTAGQPA